MAVNLVRQESDTPTITNKDDARMIRYAYGGYNGVVKGFGNECGYTSDNGIFKVLDGIIVIDGWEIKVDGAGWSLNLSNVTGIQYHSVYAQINVSVESIDIQSTYATGSYPTVEKGDDLTSSLNGSARLLLYNVQVENGVIKNVIKKFEVIPYLTQKVLDIEKRLAELGFKSGDLVDSNGVTYKNAVTKIGNYAIIRLTLDVAFTSSFPLITFTLPKEFVPETSQILQNTFIKNEVLGISYNIQANIYTKDENNIFSECFVIGVLNTNHSFSGEISFGYNLK